MTAIKEKIEYERGKCQKLEQKIAKIGGRFNAPLINLDANLKVIKDLLIKNNLITKDNYELEYFKKAQIILENILQMLEKLKKEKSKLVIPKPNIDLKKIKEGVRA